MSDVPISRLDERIAAIIERVKILASERDALQRENGELRSRLETQQNDQIRFRTVLSEAVQELRQR